ncbi:hypothetical protein SSX86_005622 [Deinandra increscens subsp. villosa]|uniref:Reverse transcriptase domain-containing protein n=1 Tax=Deinandra increscens subsp. villosa TaxID=3103831 RepID=A0AAP0DQ96_9ASTR
MNFLSINLRGIGNSDKRDWVKSLKASHKISFLAIQETQFRNTASINPITFWGRTQCESEICDAAGRSGGLISIWDPNIFQKTSSHKSKSYLLIKGILLGTHQEILIFNIYGPHEPSSKTTLWHELGLKLTEHPSTPVILLGDFNEVRFPHERLNSEFHPVNARNFNNFITNAGLKEYNMGGRKFTYVSDKGDKFSKIDRVLVSPAFMRLWPNASLTALPRVHSDHCPLILVTNVLDFGPSVFRFYNSWIGRPGYMETVNAAFSQSQIPQNTMPDRKLQLQLKSVKSALKSWNTNFRNNEDYELKIIRDTIDGLELKAEVIGLTPSELTLRQEYIKKAKEMNAKKSQDLAQKSRIKWLTDGDENSSYFHGLIRNRRAKNRINGILHSGNWITSPDALKDRMLQFFSSKFSEPIPNRPLFLSDKFKKLSLSDSASLISPFSLQEIKCAVWSCGSDKAPGPDGFNFRFIKTHWDLLGPNFLEILQHFHSTGTISPGCNSSFISLIPKRKDPLQASHFRPICLIGCIYKIISKVLAIRLKSVIASVISNTQSAYVGDRSILDGPLVLNETIAWLKQKKKKAMLFKVDFEKAFDSLNWNFLDSILTQMAFPDKWRSWIRSCLSSSKSSILVNGSPTQEFQIQRGVKQGDPLSPFLFIIAMEALHIASEKATLSGLFTGIQLPAEGPTLSHLLYADDVIFLGEWRESNCRYLARFLRCFHISSGLKINYEKCRLFGIGVNQQQMESMATILQCKVDKLPFSYLGIPIGANMRLKKHWEPIVQKFKSRLNSWKSTILSQGGKAILIKSVLGSLPSYFLSLFRAPTCIILELERLRKNFFWGNSSSHKKIPWVAWKRIMAPKPCGGLGIGSLRAANLALISKWGWRFKTEKSALWVSVIKAIHSSNRSHDILPLRKSIPGYWKPITNVFIDLADEGIQFWDDTKATPGIETSVTFWHDNWLTHTNLKSMFPNLYLLEKSKSCLVNDRILLTDTGTTYLRWNWKSQPSSPSQLHSLSQLSSILQPFCFSPGNDRWVWLGCNNLQFSTGNIRRRLEHSWGDFSFKHQWSGWIPRKVDIFVWKAALNRIPVKMELQKRGIILQCSSCTWCSSTNESSSHLLFECITASKTWDLVSSWTKHHISSPATINQAYSQASILGPDTKLSKTLKAIIAGTVWELWKARNGKEFEGRNTHPGRIFEEIKSETFLWLTHRAKILDLDWNEWKRDPLYWL